MKLTTDDQEKVKAWITDKCGNMRCFCCGMPNWNIVDIASLSIAMNPKSGRVFYSQGIPVANVVCANCGHVVTFSANMLGLKPEQDGA
jgi:hypothetical protein